MEPRVQLSASALVANLTLDVLTGGILATGIWKRIMSAQNNCEATFERLQQRFSEEGGLG